MGSSSGTTASEAERMLAAGIQEQATAPLLRLVITGSVDDGKSTLIGRLLYDSKQILTDQLEAIRAASARRNGEHALDLSLLTDGLRAEREQGITIDVAYRYFQTPHRKFIIADTPGHERYTRNMVTGASTADLAVILIDVRQGVVEQTRRHAFIASLLGIRHLLVCVNKMDLVDYAQDAFERVEQDFREFCARLEATDVTFIPISAMHGENVVERSEQMDWYQGPAMLYHLEHVHIASDRNLIDCRLPVQWVIRPGPGSGTAAGPAVWPGAGIGAGPGKGDGVPDYRAYAGQIAAGVFRAGDPVLILPSGEETRIASVDSFDGPVAEACAPMSIAVRLEDDLDISRGDMICRPHNRPTVDRHIEAIVCWMADDPVVAGGRYAIKHTTRSARAVVEQVRYRIDVNSLHRDENARAARAERHRPDLPAHDGPADLRRIPAQPDHRQLHPDRRGDQQHRGRRHDHRGAHAPARGRGRPGHLGRPAPRARRALGAARPARRHRVADRPARLGQVDDRRGARGAPGPRRLPRLPARWGQPAARPEQRPGVRSGRPGGEHPRGSRTWPACSPTRGRSRSSA